MAKIDADLAGALKKAKTKRMNFVLVEKTAGEGTLIVRSDTISGGKIDEAKRDLGGGKIYKGECFTDPATGDLIFETDSDPPAVRTLSAVIKLDAGLNLKVNARKKGKLMDDIMDAVNADKKDQATQRLNGITNGTAYKRSLSLGGPVADVLKKQVEKVKKAIDRKDFRNAEHDMDELKEMAEHPTEDI
jgi:hypothetical protein